MTATAPAPNHDAIVRDSWSRCRDFGLTHQSQPAFGQAAINQQLIDAQLGPGLGGLFDGTGGKRVGHLGGTALRGCLGRPPHSIPGP
mgnify:CR=1 FL=1